MIPTIAILFREEAGPYFGMFPSEPMLPDGLPLHIDKVVKGSSGLNFRGLLDVILEYNCRNVITVSHGTGSGLGIHLFRNSSYELEEKVVEALLKYVNGTIDEESFTTVITRSDEEKQKKKTELDALKAELPDLRRLIIKVRKNIKLEKWVMRACQVGKFPETLQKLRLLLGATVACAPQENDFFARFNPKPVFGPNAFANFLQEKNPNIDGQVPNRFAWVASRTSFGLKFEVVPESKDASARFVARHFPKGKYPGEGSFPVHAIETGGKLVFPMDPPYKGLLVRVSG